MDATTLAIVILVAAGVVVLALLYRSSVRAKGPAADVAPGQRPFYSDDELETNHFERLMLWGVVLTLFFAVFLPFYWITEHRRLSADEERIFRERAAVGEELFVENCALCHGPEAGGGAAQSPHDPDDSWPAPNLRTFIARYDENPNIADSRDFLVQTINRGRPGTPMPAFGRAAGGPLTDEQIEAIITWLVVNQEEEIAEETAAADLSGEELYTDNCAKCHAADLQGWDSEEGHPAPPLIGVFARHSRESVLGILRNGIEVPGYPMMPPWQNGYMYEGARFSDDALERIVEYLEEMQPDDVEAEDDDEEDLQEARGPGEGA